VNSQVCRELWDLLRVEEQAILESFPPTERRVAVWELVRSIDYFYLWQLSRGEQSTHHEEETDGFFIFGCNKALQLFLDESTRHDMVPLTRSTEKTRAWANSTLYRCGQIAVCEMLLDWERSQLGKFTTCDGTIRFQCTQGAVGLEAYEVEEFHWLRRFVADQDRSLMDSLMEMQPRIEQTMTPLVAPWREHYIGYRTTPEVDSHFQQRGILQCRLMFGQDSFPGEARFGGLDFDLYRASVVTLAGWMLKHLAFVNILRSKHPHLEVSNLSTIHQDKEVLAGYLVAALEIDSAAAEQCLRVLTLTHTDKPQLTMPKGPPAPLVELGRAHVLKSVAGCLNAPFDFLGASLRNKYPGDFDKAVSLREKVFRSELYSLFPQREIIRIPSQIKIRHDDRVVTDIDAAIFDPRNNIGGLFQLKWQEPFGPSIRVRDSRKKNFLAATTAWIEQTLDFVRHLTPRKLADSFGIKLSDAELIKYFRLFVIGRNFSHFSGELAPDERAAWGLWPQLLHLAAEQYDRANPLGGLYHGLKRTSPFRKPRPEIEDLRFTIGDKEIVVTATPSPPES
jgi:hypothetical protein